MSNYPTRVERAINEGYNFRLGEYINRGFGLFGQNAGMFIGYVLVYLAIAVVLSFIPILGQLVSSLISAALVAGFYIVAHKTDNNEYAEFSNFFDGFKHWLRLFLASLVIGFMVLLIMSPIIIYLVTRLGSTEIDIAEVGLLEPVGGIQLLIFWIVILLLIGLILCYIYSPLFIIFDNMEVWDSLEASRKLVMKNFFIHLLFFIAWGIIIVLSCLPLLLGLLATVPAYYCSIYAAWADITNYKKGAEEEEDDILRHLIN